MAKKKQDQAGTVRFWVSKIEKAKESLKDYREQAEKACKASRDTDDLKHTFNIQWANNNITAAAVYAHRPKPDVRRRYQKPDPDEKELARLVERAIEYNIDAHDFDTPSHRVVRDYVEVALGVPRIVYDVKTQPVPDPLPSEIEAALQAGLLQQPPEPTFDLGLEEIVSQSVNIEHVPWSQFLWEPGKSWAKVDWIAFQSFQDPREIEDKYDVIMKGGKGDEVSLAADKYKDLVTVWEIWHKPSRCIYVIAPNFPDAPLDKYEDKLNLSTFFPVPQPAMGNVKHDELIPKPDYLFIESQVKELNRITQRRQSLIKQIKDVGFYDASLSEGLAGLMAADDGTLKPVNGLRAYMNEAGGANGFDGAVMTMPNERKIQVIRELSMQAEEVKQQIYEVLGLSDIVRGASQAQETATAQQIKSQYANIRLSDKQGTVARLWRETFRIFAEIICEHFDPEQLKLMTGIDVTPRMQEMMQNDIGRSFAIDIETDSTIAIDDNENKRQTFEMIDSVVGLMERLIPAVQNGAIPVGVLQEAIMLAVSSHKHGKQLEDAIQEMGPHLEGAQQFQQQMQQMQQQLQQAMQQNQQMQQQLAQFNEREEAREDAKVQAEIQTTQTDDQREIFEAQVGAEHTKAQTAEIYHRMSQPQVTPAFRQ